MMLAAIKAGIGLAGRRKSYFLNYGGDSLSRMNVLEVESLNRVVNLGYDDTRCTSNCKHGAAG
jgi:hypothetical protein